MGKNCIVVHDEVQQKKKKLKITLTVEVDERYKYLYVVVCGNLAWFNLER